MHVKPSADEGEVGAEDGGPGGAVGPVADAPPRTRKAEQAEATRAALLAAARELFAQRGYGAVGTEEIVHQAGVTRGALYHHFSGKEDLFRAVYEDLERELMEQIAGEAASAGDPVAALHAGARAFLDACADPAVARLALVDAPSVLGWQEWREIGLRYGFGLVEGVLAEAMNAGAIERQPVRPLAHLVLGAIDEAGMVVARADDGGETRREVGEAVDRFLEHLRPRA
jgi:AcrR family transcriptional regulator